MKCNVQAISPVHIGSGEKYTASEYVKSKGKTKSGKVYKIIKRIDVSKYYISLDDNKKDKFLADLSSNKDFNLKDFDNTIPNTFMKYRCIDKCKKDISPNQDISEAIKTLNELYIPGSSIKGAIKSAILYREIDDNKIDEISHKVLRNNGSVDFRAYSKFIDKIFSSNRAPTSAQGDIMKFLQVTDSTTIKMPTVYDVVTVMASANIGRNEYYRRNKRSREPTLSFLETIDRGNKLSFEIKNNYTSDVFKRLGLEDKKRLIDINNIKKSIFIFSKSLINHEKEFAETYDMDYLTRFYNDLDKRNTIDNPVLKVGAGSGFLATTVGLKIKKYDERLYEKIRKGLRGKNYEYEFPKSRKITQSFGRPLGWIQLSFEDD